MPISRYSPGLSGLCKFVDQDLLALDRPTLVRTVKNNTQRPDLDADRLLGEIDRLVADRQISSWDLSNGHDMVQILALGLRRALGSRKGAEGSAKILESFLRVAYGKEDFRASGLCAAIRDWERRNPAYSVLG